MALALVPKPVSTAGKQALQHALDGYESILVDAEKKRLDALKASGAADTFSVIALTCEIDQSQASRISRRIGPRLQPFLENIQRFSGVADTFSQVHTAGLLIWGTVKLTLLLTSNFGSYFEKVADLFLQIGRKAPHFDEYALLYQTSEALQDALCSYYAVVIRLCRQAVVASRRKGVFQVPRAALMSFDHDFAAIKTEIDLASEEVKIQIHIASSKVQIQEQQMNQLERENNAESRKLLAKIGSQNEHQWSQLLRLQEEKDLRRLKKRREQLRKRLSDVDHRLPWRQVRKECVKGTAVWFLEKEAFVNWLVSDQSEVLWLSGFMGSGKTTVAANIVAELCSRRDSSSTCHDIVYFFCQEARRESLSLRNIVGSIAAQLLEKTIANASWRKLETLSAAVENDFDLDAIIEFLRDHIAQPGEYYIVVDGIDMCEGDTVYGILGFFETFLYKVPNASKIKILLTARHDTGMKITRFLRHVIELRPSQEDIVRDMEEYISITLLIKLESGDLLLNNPGLIENIEAYLMMGSQGMLLWTKLLIEQICLCTSDSEIIDCLGSVPVKLTDIYCQSLSRILTLPNSAIIMRILKWTTGSVRLLKPSELREAVTILPGQKHLHIGSLPHIEAVIHTTKGLVYVDDDEDTVHIVHHSLKRALQIMAAEADVGSWQEAFSFDALNLELGGLCMTYLSFEDFGSQLAKQNPVWSLTADEMTKLAQNVAEMSLPIRGIGRTAVDLLQKSKRRSTKQSHLSSSSFTVDRQLRKLAEEMARKLNIQMSVNHDFAFLKYAQIAWVEHTKALSPRKNPIFWRIFRRTATSSDDHTERPWENVGRSTWLDDEHRFARYPPQLVTALHWSYYNNHFAMMELQLFALHLHHGVNKAPSFLLSLVRTILSTYDVTIIEIVSHFLKHIPSEATSSIQDKILFDILYDIPVYTGDDETLRPSHALSTLAYKLTFDELANIKGIVPIPQIMAPVFREIFVECEGLFPAPLDEFFRIPNATFVALGHSRDFAELNLVELSIAYGRYDIFKRLFHTDLDGPKDVCQYWQYLGVALLFGQKVIAENMWCAYLDHLDSPPTITVHQKSQSALMLCILHGYSDLALRMLQFPKLGIGRKARAASLILSLRTGNIAVFKNLLSKCTYEELFEPCDWNYGRLDYSFRFPEYILPEFGPFLALSSRGTFVEGWDRLRTRRGLKLHSSGFGTFDRCFKDWESSQLSSDCRRITIRAIVLIESSVSNMQSEVRCRQTLYEEPFFIPLKGGDFSGRFPLDRLLTPSEQDTLKSGLRTIRSRYKWVGDSDASRWIAKLEELLHNLVDGLGVYNISHVVPDPIWPLPESVSVKGSAPQLNPYDVLLRKFCIELPPLMSLLSDLRLEI